MNTTGYGGGVRVHTYNFPLVVVIVRFITLYKNHWVACFFVSTLEMNLFYCLYGNFEKCPCGFRVSVTLGCRFPFLFVSISLHESFQMSQMGKDTIGGNGRQ